MLTMWMRRMLVFLLGTFLLLPLPAMLSAEPVAGVEPVEIGSVADVDTSQVRRLLDSTSGTLETPTAELTPLVLGLEEAIRIALQANLSLQIAEIDRDTANALLPAAQAKFDPVPGVDAAMQSDRLVDAPDDITAPGDIVPGTYKENAQGVIPFVRQPLPTGGVMTLSTQLLRDSIHDQRDIPPDELSKDGDRYLGGTAVTITQPLLRGGRTYVARREILDSGYNLGVAEAQLRAQILQVTARVKESYYDTVLQSRLIEVSEEALKRDRSLLDASQALFRAGRATRRDVLSAEIRISDGESSLATNRAAFDAAQLALRDTLGTPIDRVVQPSERTIPFAPVDIRLSSWLERARTNRPEIRALAMRLAQTALAARVAGNEVLPALDLLASYGRAGFSESSRTTWDMDSSAWAAGVHFEVPLGNVAARQRLLAARLQNERVERELRNQQRQIEIEVRSQVIRLRKNFTELTAQTGKVEQARAKLETANTRFRLGMADNFDVTDAQEQVVSAETAFLTAVVDYVTSLARLEASIAGPL